MVQGVIEAYLRAVNAREEVKVQERALETSQIAADGARERAKERQVTEIEVARADIRVAQTKNQLNLQKQSAQGALDALMVAIGEGVGKTPELTDAVPDIEPNIPTLADAMNKALENRVELSIYDMQLSEQERLLSVKKDKLKPSMDVVAGFNSLNNNPGLISRSLLDLGAFTAGLEYRVPMDKRALKEDRDTAARNLEVLKKLRVYQMEQVAESVRNAYRAVEASKTSVEILGQNLKIAQDNVALAQEMLDEGLDDNRNLLDGQQALTRAESGLLSAKVELYMSTINLKYAMGEDLAAIGTK
jgi:outer membrane protein TolC